MQARVAALSMVTMGKLSLESPEPQTTQSSGRKFVRPPRGDLDHAKPAVVAASVRLSPGRSMGRGSGRAPAAAASRWPPAVPHRKTNGRPLPSTETLRAGFEPTHDGFDANMAMGTSIER